VGPARAAAGAFGALLRRHRAAAGLTQEALAERARLSGRAVSALERGVIRAPRAGTLGLLAAALDLSPPAGGAGRRRAATRPPPTITAAPRRRASG
jgi:transcriptional regulator with XRE-family HTH domain